MDSWFCLAHPRRRSACSSRSTRRADHALRTCALVHRPVSFYSQFYLSSLAIRCCAGILPGYTHANRVSLSYPITPPSSKPATSDGCRGRGNAAFSATQSPRPVCRQGSTLGCCRALVPSALLGFALCLCAVVCSDLAPPATIPRMRLCQHQFAEEAKVDSMAKLGKYVSGCGQEDLVNTIGMKPIQARKCTLGEAFTNTAGTQLRRLELVSWWMLPCS